MSKLSQIQQKELSRYCLRIEKSIGFVNRHECLFFYVSIIDLTRPYFPISWVINLPSKPYNLNCGLFAKTFPNIDRQKFAIDLLNEALNAPEYANDTEIQAEIKKRIKNMTPKPLKKMVCKSCGQSFETQNKGLKTSRYCPTCRQTFFEKFKRSN